MLGHMTATVPVAPAPLVLEKDLERLIAAVLAANAWYVERSLELPGLCEADVIGTRFQPMERRMVEAKSGKNIGASDSFKFESQRRFLDIDHGAMSVPHAAPKEMDEVAKWGEFAILRSDLTRPKVEGAVAAWLGASPAAHTVDAWLRGYTIMDALIGLVRHSKARLASPTIAAAWTAFHGVNAPTWMRMTLVQRSMIAYAAFAAAPHAGRARADEIATTLGGTSGYYVFRESWAGGKHPDIHALLLLEWLNRLEVIRLAVESSMLPAPPTPKAIVFAAAPPHAFLNCVEELRKRPTIAPSLPILLQSFIFRWGGFLLPGEQHAIGSDLGLTGSQVKDGLALLDVLFPRGSSGPWMHATIGAEWLTLTPHPLQGAGAIYRDEITPGWDVGLNGTLARALGERRKGSARYL
jgi:hypothetical protein